MNRYRFIAFYLPQYYPTPSNNLWYGAGFTEWTNLGKAKKCYPGHDFPHIPGEIGYYDLRLPETREAQANLAREYGIEGFCYYHYWFGNGVRELDTALSGKFSRPASRISLSVSAGRIRPGKRKCGTRIR